MPNHRDEIRGKISELLRGLGELDTLVWEALPDPETTEPAPTEPAPTEPAPTEPDEWLLHIESSGTQSEGRWQAFQLPVEDRADLTITAEWEGDADVRLFLRTDEEGSQPFAWTRGPTVSPAVVEAAGVEPGNYVLAVLISSGEAEYRVNVTDVKLDPPPDPTEPTEPEPAPAPEPEPVPDYPGQPPTGHVWWGAAITGNGDPVERHERDAGVALGLRRTFFRWNHRTAWLLDTARDDLANGRLPWVSIKPPSWADVAAGRHDGEIDELLQGLAGLDGPVWLTVHHEPDGGGGVNAPDDPAGPAGHLAANRRVRTRMDALGIDNVALAIVLMSYAWNPRSGRNPNDWWEPGVYDFLGVDHYADSEATLINDQWLDVRASAGEWGVDVAVGEWGLRGTDDAAARRVEEWYAHAVHSAIDKLGGRVVGLSAFDSGLNSPSGSWELVGGQLQAFRRIMVEEPVRRAMVGG